MSVTKNLDAMETKPWRELPRIELDKWFLTALTIPLTLLIALPPVLLIALGGGWLLLKLDFSPDIHRYWIIGVSLTSLGLFCLFWYLQYSILAYKIYLAKAPQLFTQGSCELGESIPIRIFQQYRREVQIESIELGLHLHYRSFGDHDSAPPQPIDLSNYKLSRWRSPFESLEDTPANESDFHADGSLAAQTEVTLPTLEKWNQLLCDTAAEVATASDSVISAKAASDLVEGYLVVTTSIVLHNGIEFWAEHQLTDPAGTVDGHRKSLPSAF